MPDQDDPKERKGFTVTDRRIFSPGDSDPREPGPDQPAPAPATTAADTAAPPATPRAAPPARALPPVDFQTFVISLGSSALLHMGGMPHPEAADHPVDLVLAKHSIDLLAMLEQKTKGNLTDGEAQLLTSLLYDLRLRYVEAARAK